MAGDKVDGSDDARLCEGHLPTYMNSKGLY